MKVLDLKQTFLLLNNNMLEKYHYSGLDLLRFFAAFWVMSFHYFLGLSGELSWYRFGNLGVPLFFIVSGFVISQSISHSSIQKFVLGRFIRLFPLFWILCTCTYIFTILMPNGVPVSIPEYLISMTMLGEKLGNLFGYTRLVDPVYWSLVIELIFYFAITLFVYFFTWKKIRYFLWGWLLVSVISFLLHIDQTFIMKTLLVRHASYFIFGATLALIINNRTKKLKQSYFDYLLLFVVAVYSTFISYKALPPYFVVNPLDGDIVAMLHPIFFIVFITLIYFSKNLQTKKIRTTFGIIGGITYPLYLMHQTIGSTLLDYFKDTGKLIYHGSIIMAVMILVSYFIYLVDKKIRFYLMKRLSSKNNVT